MLVMESGGRSAEILLAEDNPDDVELARIGFERSRLSINLHHVPNGEACMDFLQRKGQYADAPQPDLLLLDLNMPLMDGREVLAKLVDDDDLKHLPVVVLTTSDDEEDVLAMYRLRCSCYATKPVDFRKFQQAIEQISDFWFTLVVRPPKEDR